jgi:hypothetical protein
LFDKLFQFAPLMKKFLVAAGTAREFMAAAK